MGTALSPVHPTGPRYSFRHVNVMARKLDATYDNSRRTAMEHALDELTPAELIRAAAEKFGKAQLACQSIDVNVIARVRASRT
jgi:hypothetical protein